ncbi:putative NADH-quinone oxidoreductase, subunit J (nuoJ) [Candidatus Sulfobium mesophilum]|uniref:NADH-quinone oxidoreductase subunit J n=1 Tax=Candidatus Sulfobium mesophilum TaxID=2016548 RepID=A0A2U3QEW5_9BACT|nr:putative NADH-quinone oxidoreductase, subunit J (nuoJ) [Candidatus Sulfobium mesophilum]
MLPKLFFGYFAVAITALSLLVVTRRNPVHSVMWMLLMFFNLASMYLFLNAEFIAAIQVIVYAGAILVLFLFVVLLLNLREELQTNRFIRAWPAGLVIALALLASIFFSISSFVPGISGRYTNDYVQKETFTKVLGQVLYTEYLFPFEIASVILLISIIGAIVLAKKRTRS